MDGTKGRGRGEGGAGRGGRGIIGRDEKETFCGEQTILNDSGIRPLGKPRRKQGLPQGRVRTSKFVAVL